MKPITIKTIITRVNRVTKRSERTIRSDLSALGIDCVGKRQRPQRYPADSPERILSALGLEGSAAR